MALIGFALGEALLHFDWFEGQAYLAGGLPGSICGGQLILDTELSFPSAITACHLTSAHGLFMTGWTRPQASRG
ncbi:hypothetical protein [Pseudomonas sp. HMWF006]|uniref:hypothetical protein n=1 Tax=Pseudomonas sp. HMWF006 TaxID=2056843 RepID=UPI000FFC19E8|nr:hypothetical protein [Pseudomonas sp. HMWF006]